MSRTQEPPTSPTLKGEFWTFPFPSSDLTEPAAVVVCRPDIHGLFILNPSAGFIWVALQHGVSPELLAARFASRFNVSLHLARKDIAFTLDAWSRSLLSPFVPPATPPVDLQPPSTPASEPSFACDYALGSQHFRLVVHNDPDFVEEIRPRLVHLQVADRRIPDTTFQVFRHSSLLWLLSGETCIGAESEVSVARTVLLQEMARLSRPRTEWFAILHGAACGSASQCVIMPAATASGKSTLAAALMHAGLEVYSDDSAAIDRQTGQVIAMPFALRLRSGSWPVLAGYFPQLATSSIFDRDGENARFLPPASQHIHTATPRCLLFVDFQAGAETRLRRLTPFESLLGLQKSGFWAPHDQTSIGSFLSWVESMPAYTIRYSNLTEVVPLVIGLVESNREAVLS